MDKIKFLLGIDPGRNTGICIYNRQTKKILEMKTLDFWQTVTLLDNFRKYMGGLMEESDGWKVIIEDPNLNTFINIQHQKKANSREILRIAQNVGMNKEDAYLLIEFMKNKKINHQCIRPVTSKWTEVYFKKLTGWIGSSSQHARDSAKLVFGY